MSNFLIFGVFQMIYTQKVLNVIKAGFHRLRLIYFSENLKKILGFTSKFR